MKNYVWIGLGVVAIGFGVWYAMKPKTPAIPPTGPQTGNNDTNVIPPYQGQQPTQYQSDLQAGLTFAGGLMGMVGSTVKMLSGGGGSGNNQQTKQNKTSGFNPDEYFSFD